MERVVTHRARRDGSGNDRLRDRADPRGRRAVRADGDGELHKIQIGFEFGDSAYGSSEPGFGTAGTPGAGVLTVVTVVVRPWRLVAEQDGVEVAAVRDTTREQRLWVRLNGVPAVMAQSWGRRLGIIRMTMPSGPGLGTLAVVLSARTRDPVTNEAMARLWQMGANYIQGYHIQAPEAVLPVTRALLETTESPDTPHCPDRPSRA